MTPSPEPVPPTSAVHHRFETLAEALAVAILTADPRGNVDYVNPAARELFWRADADLLGDGWLEAIDPDDRDATRACALDVCRSGNAGSPLAWARQRFDLTSDDCGIPPAVADGSDPGAQRKR